MKRLQWALRFLLVLALVKAWAFILMMVTQSAAAPDRTVGAYLNTLNVILDSWPAWLNGAFLICCCWMALKKEPMFERHAPLILGATFSTLLVPLVYRMCMRQYGF